MINEAGNLKGKSISTAVQLLSDDDCFSGIFFGKPLDHVQGTRGEIALFGSGNLVGYEIIRGRTRRAFLFRTVAENGTEKVPGVYPAVTLLIAARSRAHARKLICVIRFLKREKIAVEALSDLFFSRMQVLLSNPRMGDSTIRQLLTKCRTFGAFPR